MVLMNMNSKSVFQCSDRPPEPDPYDSDKDEEYQIDTDHDSESEQEFDNDGDVTNPIGKKLLLRKKGRKKRPI